MRNRTAPPNVPARDRLTLRTASSGALRRTREAPPRESRRRTGEQRSSHVIERCSRPSTVPVARAVSRASRVSPASRPITGIAIASRAGSRSARCSPTVTLGSRSASQESSTSERRPDAATRSPPPAPQIARPWRPGGADRRRLRRPAVRDRTGNPRRRGRAARHRRRRLAARSRRHLRGARRRRTRRRRFSTFASVSRSPRAAVAVPARRSARTPARRPVR